MATKKIDFSAKEAKGFVNAMEKGYDAYFNIGKIRSELLKTVNTNKSTMDTNKAVLDTLTEESADYEKYKNAYDVAKDFYEKTKKRLDDTIAVENKRIGEATAMFDSDTLYNAYVDYITKDGDVTAYADALAAVFVKNGIADATGEYCQRYLRAVGAGNANVYRTGNVHKAVTRKTWLEGITKSIIQHLKNDGVLDVSKYEFKAKKSKSAK